MRDLHEASAWYEAEVEGLGRDFVRAVDEAIHAAAQLSMRFPDVHRGVRRVLVKRFPYGVYFRVEQEQLIVFAIMHLHRDPGRWQQRDR